MQMLANIDAGLISTVIVKDMSRFSRNYLEVGLYTEIHFPEKGVRFIAINSNVDSDNPTENEFTPFLNVINEWYAKDTSRKIRAIFRSRMAEGLWCSGSVPYGYTRLPGDKQTFVIDEEAAAVVRKLATKECANWCDGSCIPEDRPCHVINPAYSTIYDGCVDCDWFIQAVLHLQPELRSAYWHKIFREEGQAGEGWKECPRCHKPFVPGSNRQQYCADCAGVISRTKNRERQRRYRQNQRAGTNVTL